MIEASSDLLRKSSAIFGNLRKSSVIFENFRKMFGNVRVTFGQVLENLRKSSESGRKSSENRQKRRYQYVYIIKRTLHVSSKKWILCSCGRNNISLFAALFLSLEHKIHLFFFLSIWEKNKCICYLEDVIISSNPRAHFCEYSQMYYLHNINKINKNII